MAKTYLTMRVDEGTKLDLQRLAILEKKTLTDFILEKVFCVIHLGYKSDEENNLTNEIQNLETIMEKSSKTYARMHSELSQRIYLLEQIAKANLVEAIKTRVILDNVYPDAAEIIHESSLKKFVTDLATKEQNKAQKLAVGLD